MKTQTNSMSSSTPPYQNKAFRYSATLLTAITVMVSFCSKVEALTYNVNLG